VGNNPDGPLADGNTCTAAFHEGGFIEVNLTGKFAYLFREGDSVTAGDPYYNLAEFDLFEMPNIVGSATVITNFPTSIKPFVA